MTSNGLAMILCAECVWLRAPNVMVARAQGPSKAGPVATSGLIPTHTLCELLTFSIKNGSQQELYIEVYAENFKSGSWTEGFGPSGRSATEEHSKWEVRR